MSPHINVFFQLSPSLLPWVLIVSLLIWAVLLWRTYNHKPHRRRALRMVLISAAILSLLLAILQPNYLKEQTPEKAILLTENSGISQLDSLKKLYPGAAIFTLEGDEKRGQPIPDLTFLIHQRPEIQQLFILGNGLSPAYLDQAKHLQVHLLLNPKPAGVLELHYSNNVIAGKDFHIEGIYKHTAKKSERLVLESPAGRNELLIADTAGNFPFNFRFQTKETGRYLFKVITEGSEKQILNVEHLPVVVEEARQPDILLLNAAPSFETNYLKNWLADEGYRLAVRSLVSKGKYRFSFHNRPEIQLQNLSRNRLQQFDLVILSTFTLAKLPQIERQLLKEAVTAGLGLCLLAEAPFPPPELSQADRSFFLDFPFVSGVKTWEATKGLVLEKLPLQFGTGIGISSLASGNGKASIAALRPNGSGRIGINLIPNTYQLLLGGQNRIYQNFWTPILEETARPNEKFVQFAVPQMPALFPDQPLEIQMRTAIQQPKLHIFEPDSSSTTVAIRQHPFDQSIWKADYWPKASGWHRAEVTKTEDEEMDKKEDLWFYVQTENAWRSLSVAQQTDQNEQWAWNHPPLAKGKMEPVKAYAPVPLWWFYLIFLLSSGLLWLEEKW